MNRTYIERLKTYTLLFLIIASIAQSGILWNIQGQGFPFSFLSSFLESKNINKSDSEFFEPSRIIVSEGEDSQRYILNNKNTNYNELWGQAKDYLNEIFTSKQLQVSTLDEGFSDILLKKGFVFEFNATLSPSTMAWFLGVENSSGRLQSDIYKVAILPWDNINFDKNTICIWDGKQENSKIYKFVVDIRQRSFNKDKYESIINGLKLQDNLRSYNILKETAIKIKESKLNIKSVADELLFITTGSKYETIKTLSSSVPEAFGAKSYDVCGKLILDQEYSSYEASMEMSSGNKIFSNQSNIYKVFKDGLIDYRYLGPIDENDKGSVEASLAKALEYIKIKSARFMEQGIMSNADIVLSEIKIEKGQQYEFLFDYSIDGKPISTDYIISGGVNKDSGDKLKNAIRIKANSKRVLECSWVINKLELLKEEYQYNVYFVDLLDKIAKMNEVKNISIKDIFISYQINNDITLKKLEPVWQIKTTDNNAIIVKMDKKKGE